MTALRLVTTDPVPSLAGLLSQPWPSNRDRVTFRDVMRQQADAEPRTVYCGFCGAKSPLLDGPTGRAWFAAHACPPEAAA